MKAGEVLVTIHANDDQLLKNALKEMEGAFQISTAIDGEQPLIYKIIEA